MQDWRTEILGILEANAQRRYKVKDLQRALGVPAGHYRRFREQVLDLARQGHIASYPRRRFQALTQATLLEAEVEGVGQRPTRVALGDGTRLPAKKADQASVLIDER